MPRFFIENVPENGTGIIRLSGDSAHHIRDVLRLEPGDEILACDSAGTEYSCRITSLAPGQVDLVMISRQPGLTEPPYEATLYQGLAKGEKMELIIQKAVELGVSKIVPVRCERSVVKLDREDAVKKCLRWNRIAESAAKQCGRGRIPDVAGPADFAAAVAEAAKADIKLLPWELEDQQTVRDVLECWPDPIAGSVSPSADPTATAPAAAGRLLSVSVIIGPEGGFTAKEAETAIKAGCRPVSLGRRILRTETAGAAVLAMLLYRFEKF